MSVQFCMTVDAFTYLCVPYPSLLNVQLVTTQTWAVGWRVFRRVLDSRMQYTLSICTVPGLLFVSLNCWLIGSDFLFILESPVPCFHALHRADIQEICVDLDIKLCSSFEVTVHNRVLLLSKSLVIFQQVCMPANVGS